MVDSDDAHARTAALLATALVAVAVVGLVFGPLAADTSPWAAVTGVSGTDPVTVSYDSSDGPGQFTVTGVEPELSGSSWAFLDREALPASLARMDGNLSAGVLTVGEWTLVGETAHETVSVDNTTLTVVVPAGRDVDPGRKASFLQTYLAPYSLAPSADAPVFIVAAPRALPSVGRMYDDGRGYVTETAFWDGDAGSVWIHEFVHARQRFTLAPEMAWFGEASAEYLSYRVLADQYEGVTEADVRSRLEAVATERVVLADRTTWAGTTHYHRGARLLYVLDAAIRAGSEGEQTLVDVFRAMNGADEPVTLGRFITLVERHAGRSLPWLDDAITGRVALDERLAAVDPAVFLTSRR